MKQCENCTAYEQLGRCGPLVVDQKPDKRRFCLVHDNGIPAKYWTDKEPCPARLEKQ